MSVREFMKMLLVKECMTLTELAKQASKVSKKKITVDSISRKLQKETMKFNEAEFLAGILGYKINFERMN
ncbi:MAG: hypothetical protein PHC64_03600 [Candidatus Gastranaerophilales bacterium]|nr:hypothetical protein [Candidatus Gastranaerophilales bacterium]